MDKSYWDIYYKNFGTNNHIIQPSSFAQFVLNNYLLEKKFNIVELGSGNGRDAIFFAHHSHNIYALDQSKTATEVSKQGVNNEILKYFHPKARDFVLEDYSSYNEIDMFYSRFTMHSITKDDEDLVISKVYNSLLNGGLFCIEARTINDPLFGIGEDCGQNTFINNNHKRRFIDTSEFRKQVIEFGFKELFFVEENNLSIVRDDNPTLMRIVLEK
tara:strand:+ start:619 stop:1263 length:645 start_codon:yes stop_codon:yes gene_type:complete